MLYFQAKQKAQDMATELQNRRDRVITVIFNVILFPCAMFAEWNFKKSCKQLNKQIFGIISLKKKKKAED